MKQLLVLFLFSSTLLFSQQVSISGIVVDKESGSTLVGCNIFIQGTSAGTVSDKHGKFSITFDKAAAEKIIFSYVGYYQKEYLISSIDLSSSIKIELESKIIPSQTVLVTGGLGTQGITPTTFSTIKRAEIQSNYTYQDIPEYLSILPSTTFYSEGGNGIGYNYISIRGFDQRRISVSINGIPQNDPEDHNVYWLDFPDLLGSVEMIQVQRGAGSGVTGYPAIGGAINIITSTFSDKPFLNLSASYGSNHTRKYDAAYSSGLIDNKYSIFAKLSQILTSGYRNNSWAKFNAYHLSAVRYDENLTTQINLFGGPISDGLAYNGLPKFAVKDKELRRKNYSYWEANETDFTYVTERRPEEIENFSQPHYELLNEYIIDDNFTFNSALFLVLGNGFFDYDGSWADTKYFRLTEDNGFTPSVNPGNVIIRAMVENKQYGWIPRLSYKYNQGEVIFGGELRKHSSVHWGSLIYGENLPKGITKDYRYYQYNGGKDIYNFFIHKKFQLTEKMNLLGELQVANHKYKFNNEEYVGTNFSVSNTFINPRMGINYRLTESVNIYTSFARVTREPRLKNYYDAAESSGGAVPQFAVDINGNYDFKNPLVKPESMNNVELGASLIKENYTFSFNLFYMLFDNEIIRSGQLDRFGQPVTGNIDKTLHRGIELTASVKTVSGFQIIANATFSDNIIEKGNTFIRYRNSEGQRVVFPLDISGNKIGGFPSFMANGLIRYQNYGMNLQLTGKYVGKYFTDNYDKYLYAYLENYPRFVDYTDNNFDPYFVMNFYGSYEFQIFNSLSPTKIFFQVNNVFNKLYASYAIGKEFYPAAERNFLVGIQLGL